mmetsp:Transcript_17555/g.25625  ORF Transcript_17555/g.25625 Transcript_17555/m.25625 type:complete len:154 (+) Transcript_17555:142-603(+)|eukprot:CAMPEP_0197232524 /NCGR_PEP_ID=MMETSP1429-20130617/776_1 /TAXON_ID=49237 /ORGANISM="Chaetoceros  sp., Strain UNC1202" /LENGTH=153 /DNA_ID=CAMNT_0042690569 /DNA_START=175 /DNA_END=636 /DNA_ORIENTATION=+
MSNPDYEPSTVLIMLGPLHFEHSGSADVLSIKITTPEERTSSLQEASGNIKDETVSAFHVILKASSVSSLYDDSILTTFVNGLRPGAEVQVHALGSADMPVQPGDVDTIRVSIVTAGLRLIKEGITEGEEGGWVLVAQKPGLSGDDDDDDEDE